MEKKKKGAGGKLNRSQIVQARLNPKLHFGAELVARFESRTLSSLIETSLENYLRNYRVGLILDDDGAPERDVTLNDLLEKIWNPDEVVRFVNMAFELPDQLNDKEQKLWCFIEDTPYFWSYYEVTVKDYNEKFLRQDWQQYLNSKGLLIENLKKYWDKIQIEEARASIKIPDHRGKEIKPPADVDTVIYEEYDYSKSLVNDVMVERDRYSIWLKHVPSLIKKEFETVQTPEGEKVNLKIVYPTPQEQMEMVERIYQEQLPCQSSSTK